MRRHGWSGDIPADDQEAVARIIAAARSAIDARGTVSVSEVAQGLGVTRQTVYRYFPNTEALMEAAAVASVGAFLDRIETHLAGITDPATAVTEGLAHVLETLPPHIGLLLSPLRPNRFSVAVTSGQARTIGRSMLDRFDVDWGAVGYGDAELDDLTEYVLRTLQSFIVDPGDPPSRGAELRRYLSRWVGAAVSGSRPRTS